jgi:hypothetical protein
MSEPTQSAFEIHAGITLKGQLSMVKDIVLTGRFEGDLQTLGCLTVAPGGVIVGTIDAGSLVLKDGNRVEARVRVGPPPKPVSKSLVDANSPLISGMKRGFQKLKEFALGRV